MEDNEEEEDDDMYPEYGDTATGECDAPPFAKGRTPVYCAIPWISR
jgi:hypothetical protein